MDKILGLTINFGDGEGNQYQGTVVGAWLDRSDEMEGEGTIRVVVLCQDNRFREAYLTNCVSGAIPRKKEE